MLDSRLTDQLTDGGMALLRNPMQLVNESPGPANLDSNGVCHDANTAIASARRQPHVGTFGLDFRQMAENFLGALMRVSEDGERTQCQVCGSWHFTDPERQARLDRGEW